nr:hypothetical protein BaRGS_000577 [Batillaria attramentaria]
MANTKTVQKSHQGVPRADSSENPFPVPRDLGETFKRGDFDILIVSHKVEGITDTDVQKTIEKGLAQLTKARKVLRHLVSDFPEDPTVTTVLALPNVPRTRLKKLAEDPSMQNAFTDGFETTSAADALSRCLCLEEAAAFSDLQQNQDGVPDPDVPYIHRFCGRYSRLPEATTADCINLTGVCFGRSILREEQLNIMNSEDRFVFVIGPPGTGKTLVLGLKAAEWAMEGYHVIIVCIKGVNWGSLVSWTLHDRVMEKVKSCGSEYGRKRRSSSKCSVVTEEGDGDERKTQTDTTTHDDTRSTGKPQKGKETQKDFQPKESTEEIMEMQGGKDTPQDKEKESDMKTQEEKISQGPSKTQKKCKMQGNMAEVNETQGNRKTQDYSKTQGSRETHAAIQARHGRCDRKTQQQKTGQEDEMTQEGKNAPIDYASFVHREGIYADTDIPKFVQEMLDKYKGGKGVKFILDECQKQATNEEQKQKLSSSILEDIDKLMISALGVLFQAYHSLTFFVVDKLFAEVRQRQEEDGSRDISLWSSSVCPHYKPEGFLVKELGEILRCPPTVQEVMMLTEKDLEKPPAYDYVTRGCDANPPLPSDGPDVMWIDHAPHMTSIKEVIDCWTCGDTLADYLISTLGVGKTQGKKTANKGSLQPHDVIISGAPIHHKDCKFVQALKERGVRFEYERQDLDSPPPYPGKAFVTDGGWLFVSRVFSFLGLLTGVAGLVLLLLSILVTRWRDSKLLTVLPMLLDFLAASSFAIGGCILASALTFANNYQDTFTNMPRLDWSFALDCMAGLAACVAGLFMLLRRLGACP